MGPYTVSVWRPCWIFNRRGVAYDVSYVLDHISRTVPLTDLKPLPKSTEMHAEERFKWERPHGCNRLLVRRPNIPLATLRTSFIEQILSETTP